MVDDATLCVGSASARAWIYAFISGTSQGSDTVGVDDAFGPAAAVWIPKVLPPTGTLASIASDSWISIGPAWVGIARISRWW